MFTISLENDLLLIECVTMASKVVCPELYRAWHVETDQQDQQGFIEWVNEWMNKWWWRLYAFDFIASLM